MVGFGMATATGSSLAPPACPSTLSNTSTKLQSAVTTCRRRRRRTGLSCRATAGDNDDGELLWLPRRDVLAGLTGLAACSSPAAALAKETCMRGDKVTDQLLSCKILDKGVPSPCPPVVGGNRFPVAVDFTPPPAGAPPRVRRLAHLMDQSAVDKYELALAKMRALPDSDPRSFTQQAAIHQAYCDGHYRYDPTEKNAPFDVHFSWIFAPWHRMYIYFYERILGDLIGDPNFALPYWNWDAPAGMALPAMFKDPKSALYDANRNPAHVDAFVDLDFLKPGDKTPVPFDPKAGPDNDMVKNNLAAVYNQMIRQGRGTRCFLGEKFCTRYKGTQKSGTAGTLETKAHTAVHVWAGNPASEVEGHRGKQTGADMGFLGSAARDPAFYSHHSNVDRMWHLWNTKLGGRNFSDKEWLDTSFAFYDEKQRLVRIKVRDVVDTAKLGYTYADDEPLLWLDSKPTKRQSSAGGGAAARSRAATPVFPLTLREGQVVVVPGVARPRKQAGQLEAVVFDAVEFDPAEAAKFDVVINVPPELAAGVGPQYVEYAGSFASLPRGGDEKSPKTLVVPLELPVEDVLADIGVGSDNSVDVVIVPRTSGITIISPPKIESRNCDPASA